VSYLIKKALNSRGDVVSINDVNKNSFDSYSCPLCSCSLVARQGQYNEWSFAHPSNSLGKSPCGDTDLYLLMRNQLLEEKQIKILLPEIKNVNKSSPLIQKIQEDFIEYYAITAIISNSYPYNHKNFYLNFDFVEFEQLRKNYMREKHREYTIYTPVFAGYLGERKILIEIHHNLPLISNDTAFGENENYSSVILRPWYNITEVDYFAKWKSCSFSLSPYQI
jgi:hypothetical protein